MQDKHYNHLMSNLRRYFKDKDIVFITIVTFERRKILIDNYDLLNDAIKSILEKIPVEIIAYVFQPDHIHLLVDSKGYDIPNFIQRIKMSFGIKYRIRVGEKLGRVWQNRYWDHIIRDQNDLNRHLDYIHYNPVKHGMVQSPFDWEYSSIQIYKEIYSVDWGVIEKITFDGDYGE